jgi:hypothetical protein
MTLHEFIEPRYQCVTVLNKVWGGAEDEFFGEGDIIALCLDTAQWVRQIRENVFRVRLADMRVVEVRPCGL